MHFSQSRYCLLQNSSTLLPSQLLRKGASYKCISRHTYPFTPNDRIHGLLHSGAKILKHDNYFFILFILIFKIWKSIRLLNWEHNYWFQFHNVMIISLFICKSYSWRRDEHQDSLRTHSTIAKSRNLIKFRILMSWSFSRPYWHCYQTIDVRSGRNWALKEEESCKYGQARAVNIREHTSSRTEGFH